MSLTGLRRAAFVDRDGTIIREIGYLDDPAAVELIDGAAEALLVLQEHGFANVIVTNQSGIARGRYGLDAYRAVQRRLLEELRRHGVRIAASYFCPHHPDFTGPCECRKPAPGMYRQAARELNLDLAASLYIGDRISDVEAGRGFGGATALVRTGYGEEQARRAPPDVTVHADLAAAVDALVAHPTR